MTGFRLLLFALTVLLNVLVFCLFGIDKRRARNGHWRIPEAVLLWLSFSGGSVGGLFGMYLFHHKTNHTRFKVLLPLFVTLHFTLISLYAIFTIL